MRIASGVTDQFIYFVTVDVADHITRVDTGLNFVVKRSRNGGAWTTYTTPTVNSTDTGGDAIWELLLDEDMTMAAGNFSEEMVVHIEDTGGRVDPVTRVIELFRPPGGDTGQLNVNVTHIVGDTGAAIHVAQMADEYDTGRLPAEAAATLDTGAVNDAVWQTAPGTSIRTLTNIDTGAAIHLAQMADEHDTGRIQAEATATLDTGAIHDAVWNVAPGDSTRALTTFGFDTGVAQTVWRESPSTYTGDTGSAGYAQGRLMAAHGDTGAIHIVSGKLAATDSGVVAAVVDTGKIAAAIWVNHAARTVLDTGISDAVWAETTRTLTAFAFDTGVADTVWKASRSTYTDTGSFGFGVNVHEFRNDTGPANRLSQFAGKLSDSGTLDTGTVAGDTGAANRFLKWSRDKLTDSGTFDTGTGISATASVDTGQINQAVWQADASRLLTGSTNIDTGIAQATWRESRSTYTDTGSFGFGINVHEIRDDTGAAQHLAQLADEYDTGRLPAEATSTLDTGATKDAVWGTAPGTSTRELTGSANIDTGIADTVWKYSVSGAAGDTGSTAYAQGRLMAAHGDTGAIHLVSGRLAATDSGIVAAVVDTGKIAAAIWVNHAARTVLDTGIVDGVWEEQVSAHAGDTGSMAYAQGRLLAVHGDTGAVHIVSGRLAATDSGIVAAVLDTGKVASAVWTSHATRALTAFAFDTGIWGSNSARTLTSFAFDTGVADTVWKASRSTYTDTGSFGFGVNIHELRNDTGAAQHLAQLADEYDTGRLPAEATASLDTGATKDAVWGTAPGTSTRYLTGSENIDTGIADQVWKQSRSTYTDTGSFGFGVSVHELRSDTGAAQHLAQLADEYDTGRLPAEATATLDTGAVHDAVWQTAAGVSDRYLTGSANIDTGIADTIWKSSGSAYTDTGSLGNRLDRLDTGSISDTGSIADAVWAYATRVLTASTNLDGMSVNTTQIDSDTGAANRIRAFGDKLSDSGTLDTGTMIGQDTGAIASAVWNFATRTLTASPHDTGIASAVWNAASRTLTAFGFDTGIAQTVWREQRSTYVGDTGSLGYGVNVHYLDNDTGKAAHLGQLADEYDTGRLPSDASASLDTGQVNQAVWQADASRTLTSWAFDTGVQQKLDRLDTGMSETIDRILADTDTGLKTGLAVNVDQLDGDTGAADVLGKFAERLSGAGGVDTGVLEGTQVGTIDANITYVNETQVQGTGDTGTADTWRPV